VGLTDSLVASLPVGDREAGRIILSVLSDGGSHREAMRAAKMKQGAFDALLGQLQSVARLG
jgi:hypothetical protein